MPAGLLDQLVAVVNLLVQSRACPAVAPFLAGANFVALLKPSGRVRPIGEVLRRLTGKCLMQLVPGSLSASVDPSSSSAEDSLTGSFPISNHNFRPPIYGEVQRSRQFRGESVGIKVYAK